MDMTDTWGDEGILGGTARERRDPPKAPPKQGGNLQQRFGGKVQETRYRRRFSHSREKGPPNAIQLSLLEGGGGGPLVWHFGHLRSTLRLREAPPRVVLPGARARRGPRKPKGRP